VYWLLVVYTSFTILRIPGMTASQTVQKNIFKPGEMGEGLVRLNIRNSVAQLLSQITSFLVLSVQVVSDIVGLVFLTFLGSVSNTISAGFIRKIPSRENVELRKGKNLMKVFRDNMGQREIRLTQITRWFGLSAFILISLTVPFLRREVGIPANMVFLYTVIGSVAAILAGYATRPFVDRVGGKPLLTFASFMLAFLALLWSVSGTHRPLAVYFIYGFFTFFFLTTRLMLTAKLIIQAIPEQDRISYTAITDCATAFIALIVGLLGGYLIDVGQALQLPVFHSFSLVFLLAALLSCLSAFFCLLLEAPGSLSIREAAGIFLSTRNLRAFLDAYQLDSTEDQERRQIILFSLEKSDAPAATHQMRRLLRTPLPWEKERVLRSLFQYPRQSLLGDIAREARDTDSYNRRDAIFTLGAYRGRKVERVLEGFLDDEDREVVSTALKSLARIGSSTHADRVKELLRDASSPPRVIVDCIIALSRMDASGSYLRDVFDIAGDHRSPTFSQLIFIICTRRLQLTPPLSDFFEGENLQRGSGCADFLSEAKELRPFYAAADTLEHWYRRERYDEVWNWCRAAIEDAKPEPPLSHLAKAVRAHEVSDVEPAGTLAALYFTYQILLAAGAAG